MTVSDLLLESLERMREELPEGYRRVCKILSGQIVHLYIDKEPIWVSFSTGAVVSTQQTDETTATVQTSRQTILDVLDGKESLVSAIQSHQLDVRTDIAVMAILHDGLLAYVHGAVRCPSFPAILERFRRSV